jgi:hypothetical protein
LWWTRAKIAFLGVLLHTAGFAAFWSAVSSPALRLCGLMSWDVVVVVLFALETRRRGAWHRRAASRASFLERVWNKRWGRTGALDGLSGSATRSLYRRVLPDDPVHRDSLYRALSAREAERLLHPASIPVFAVSLIGSSLAGVSATNMGLADVIGLCGLVVPLTATLLLDAPMDLLARRAMLREGTVERAAVLLPRDVPDGEPFLDRWSARTVVVAVGVFVGVPATIVAAMLYYRGGQEARELVLVLLRGLAFAAAVFVPYQLLLRVIRQRIPFTKFPGPVIVSLLLDIQSRVGYRVETLIGLVGLLQLGLMLFGADDLLSSAVVGATPWWVMVYAIGLFSDQADGPIFSQNLEEVRRRVELALRRLPAIP